MHSATGFILNKKAARESDWLLTIFSDRFGKMDVVARGGRKPESKMSPHLQLFDLLEYGFVAGKNHNILTAANSARNFSSVKKDISKNIAMARLMDLLEKFSGSERNDHLWERSLGFMDWLEREDISGSGQLDFVLAKITNFFLENGGFTPKTDGCVICLKNNPTISGFSFKDGGLVCSNCQPERTFFIKMDQKTAEALKAITASTASGTAVVSEIRKARQILDDFLCFTSSVMPSGTHLDAMAKKFLFV